MRTIELFAKDTTEAPNLTVFKNGESNIIDYASLDTDKKALYEQLEEAIVSSGHRNAILNIEGDYEFIALMFSKSGYTGSQIPRPLKIESEVLESSAQELIMLSTSL